MIGDRSGGLGVRDEKFDRSEVLLRRTRDRGVPDAFTPGTGEQRVRWFRRGRGTGEGGGEPGDTFTTHRL